MRLESKDFPSGLGNSLYVCLNAKSIITEIEDVSLPTLKFNFIDFDKINEMEKQNKCGRTVII